MAILSDPFWGEGGGSPIVFFLSTKVGLKIRSNGEEKDLEISENSHVPVLLTTCLLECDSLTPAS